MTPNTPQVPSVWKLSEVSDVMCSTNDMIKLTAREPGLYGDSDNPFRATVQKDLLCLHSPYFRAALKGNFAEASKDSLVLDLDDRECSMFVTWLNTGKLLRYDGTAYFPLYVFADQTNNLALRRSIMTAIIKGSRRDPLPTSFEDVTITIDSLPDNSPLCRWLKDTLVHHCDIEDWSESDLSRPDMFPATFWFEVAKGLALLAQEEDQSKCSCCTNACNYHEHESLKEWMSTCGRVNNVQTPPDDRWLKNSTVTANKK